MTLINKKEQERDELHRAIWAIADQLRGAVDGWDFKNYVLGTMFYRYISENIVNYINTGEYEAGNIDFDYSKLSDDVAEAARQGLVEEKVFLFYLQNFSAMLRKKQKIMRILTKLLIKYFVTLRNLLRAVSLNLILKVYLMILT